MDKATEQEKKEAERPTTPKNPENDKSKTVGSSCTWRKDELERFAVSLEHGVDPHQIIPAKFWMFDRLMMYTKRTGPIAIRVAAYKSWRLARTRKFNKTKVTFLDEIYVL
jgi:hypothetical protein